jgi:ribosomal protein L11 methyltransferase
LKWLEVSLSLTGELAEAAVGVLSRYAPNSIAMEYEDTGAGIDPAGIIILRAYLPDDDDLDRNRQAIEESLWHLSQIKSFDPPRFDWVEEQNWEDSWKARYQPIRVGECILIQPAWLPAPETNRVVILMDPGMAFGTGTHPTTQLCLLALEKHLVPGARVVDLGCGSGILSIGAIHLGAGEVLALDTDGTAVDSTRQNAAANSLAGRINVLQGSLEVLRSLSVSTGESPDLLVANILSKVILDLLQQGLGESVRPGGILVLSGILDNQAEEVVQAAGAHSLEHLETGSIDDWRAIVLKRKPVQ